MKALFLAAIMALGLGAAPAPTPPTATVHIKNFAFMPPSLTVAAGTTVRFVNDDTEAHTATATDRSFDSGGLDTGDAWAHRFAKPGKVAYFCAVHPYMHASIVVTGSQ